MPRESCGPPEARSQAVLAGPANITMGRPRAARRVTAVERRRCVLEVSELAQVGLLVDNLTESCHAATIPCLPRSNQSPRSYLQPPGKQAVLHGEQKKE